MRGGMNMAHSNAVRCASSIVHFEKTATRRLNKATHDLTACVRIAPGTRGACLLSTDAEKDSREKL